MDDRELDNRLHTIEQSLVRIRMLLGDNVPEEQFQHNIALMGELPPEDEEHVVDKKVVEKDLEK